MRFPNLKTERFTLADVVSLVAIMSAVSFVVSGVTHFIIFTRFYRFNYFAIASPADIVIGGFVTFAFVGFITAFAMSGLWVLSLLQRRFRRGGTTWGVQTWMNFAASTVFAAIVGTWGLTLWGDQWPDAGTGLVVARDTNVREDCRGASVGWIGSEAAVVACNDGFRVFRNLDEIEMIPWIDQLEADQLAARIDEGGRDRP